MSNFLKLEFSQTECELFCDYTHRLTPFIRDKNEICFSPVKGFQKLTKNDDVKRVYCVTFESKEIQRNFVPGDCIGVLPHNDSVLVQKIIERLKLSSICDKECNIEFSKKVLKHLPLKSSIRNILLSHVDLQTAPKKLFLKSLMKYTSDPKEIHTLQSLSSIKSEIYLNFITENKTVLDVLETFPLCQPPIELLLEHLPPLLPRPFSICNWGENLEITFTLVQFDSGKKGLCTGWLESVLHQTNQVAFYLRQSSNFLLPTIQTKFPVILIATGTGIAPFRSFLQYLQQEKCERQVWLFYGCRYSDRDCLFKNELEGFVKNRVLAKLNLVFSRENRKSYVQDCIKENCGDVKVWVENGAQFFVCGDFRTVVKDVKNCLQAICDVQNFFVDNWC